MDWKKIIDHVHDDNLMVQVIILTKDVSVFKFLDPQEIWVDVEILKDTHITNFRMLYPMSDCYVYLNDDTTYKLYREGKFGIL
jgi:hypothetical protein